MKNLSFTDDRRRVPTRKGIASIRVPSLFYWFPVKGSGSVCVGDNLVIAVDDW